MLIAAQFYFKQLLMLPCANKLCVTGCFHLVTSKNKGICLYYLCSKRAGGNSKQRFFLKYSANGIIGSLKNN